MKILELKSLQKKSREDNFIEPIVRLFGIRYYLRHLL